jgi:hypothetical protein
MVCSISKDSSYMLEIKNSPGERYRACLDEKALEYTNVSFLFETKQFLLEVNNYEEVEKVCCQRLLDIPKNLRIELSAKNRIKLDERFINLNDHLIRKIWITTFEQQENIAIEIKFGTKILRWRKSYNYADYLDAFIKANDLFEQYKIAFKRIGENIVAQIIFSSNEKNISEAIFESSSILVECHKKIETDLLNNVSRESLIASFNFPEELKITCEQYLLYFAQFLQDLGINANPTIKEEAGKVLFSVTPTDDVEALDKIREALAIYLSLPSNPIPNSTGDRTVDMVLSGARANAKHLESQLELAIAKLQFKEATLELKDATIEQNHLALRQKDETIKELQEIVARGNIFQESLERVEINGEVVDESSLYRFSRTDDIEIEATPALDEKTEETRVGLVKFHEVTKLKDYGVSLDLPKAIRDLIDYFKRDKS